MPRAIISDRIFEQGRNGLSELIEWLDENVGEYYCIGEHPVMRIGAGWEIASVEECGMSGISIRWELDITDEKKFMLYCLRWT